MGKHRMYVPDVGDELTLAADWTFTLHQEYRNNDVIEALGLKDDAYYKRLEERAASSDWHVRQAADRFLSSLTWRVTLPRGTVLRVDRLYVRKGASDYSSLSFYVEKTSLAALTPAKKGGGFKKGRRRFWAKLGDVNEMRIER